MKWIKLRGSAYVNGVLRHPHEGVLHLEDEEGQRLLDNELGEDVSDDFTAKQDKAPAESLTVASGGEPAPKAEHPHQADIKPEPEAAPAKTASKKDTGK